MASGAVDPDAWYTAREVVDLLGRHVTEATVKEYCKRGMLDSKRVGPKRQWYVRGAAVQKLRAKWNIDLIRPRG